MKTQLATIATLALLFAAGCFPDVGEGKAKASVSAPAPTAATATKKVEATKVATRTVAIDASKSTIAAVGAKVTMKHDIAFDDWSGSLKLAGDKLEGLDVEIKMDSLRADHEKLTGHLKSPDFFDVAKFPTATFTATTIAEKAGADGATHEITGNMTMHGVTKTLSFPAKIKVGEANVQANADFVIDRKDFGIVYPGMPDDLIKDDVALSISLVSNNPGA